MSQPFTSFLAVWNVFCAYLLSYHTATVRNSSMRLSDTHSGLINDHVQASSTSEAAVAEISRSVTTTEHLLYRLDLTLNFGLPLLTGRSKARVGVVGKDRRLHSEIRGVNLVVDFSDSRVALSGAVLVHVLLSELD